MAKYYIKSGDLQYIIDTPDYMSAILAGIKYAQKNKIILGPRICYSEQGFETFKNWICYDTLEYTKE